jgi:two-component system phosphate regulon sensor histidine kinase PhoR
LLPVDHGLTTLYQGKTMEAEKTELKSLETDYIETALHGIQELKNNLATQIAHNFRTPLTSVLGFAEILLDDRPLTNEQRVEYARFIQYEGIRLSKLIDDLLELSALEQGKSQLQLDETTLQDMTCEAIRRISEFATARSVSIKADFADTPCCVRCDREKITQAIYQLLHNAVRFTGSSNEVSVSIEVVRKFAQITVRDAGPGIQVEDIPGIFERFGRSYRPEHAFTGAGVGLAIVKHIIDLHRGEIDVQSTLGKGSAFTLRIPQENF